MKNWFSDKKLPVMPKGAAPAREWFLQLPTPAGKAEFAAVMQVMGSLREKPEERLCIWVPNAPELVMEIRHCAGGYLVKERTDRQAEEDFDEALKKVKFQYYYETLDEAEEMLRSFCCGADALVTVDEAADAVFRWSIFSPAEAICV